MTAPDFLRSRRQLRRARLQDALSIPREGVNITLHRNRLIEQLVLAADNPVEEFGSLDPNTVDIVVSLALADVDEKAVDTLSVVLLCIRVLAADGQFARVNLLAERLDAVSRRLTIDRPFMAIAAQAFALALESNERSAVNLLIQQAPDGYSYPSNTSLGRVVTNDLLMVTTLRLLLIENNISFAYRALNAALAIQDGLLFGYLEAIISWHEAATKAQPARVLSQADPTFSNQQLQYYLDRRRIQVLYPAQIKAIQGGATLDKNYVVSLPTSSGKTLIAEFRVAAALTRKPGSRVIYVAPYRMLARQVEQSFSRGLSPLSIRVRDLGSGFDPSLTLSEGALPDVAICTPERLDALLRLSSVDTPSGANAAELLASTNVMVFDELQLVGRSGRGPRFELILARLRAKYPNMLILGLSAAAQGADDLAYWLTDTEAIAGASRPTGTLEIVWRTNGTLSQRVDPRPTAVAHIPRTAAVDDATELILRLNARYRPVLAVEPSRPLAESLARKISERGIAIGADWRDTLSPAQLDNLNVAIEEIRHLLGEDHPLPQYMETGVAFHHAGVPTHALQQIEQLAANHLLRVVCSTTTVAEGADLPFRAVILPHLNFPGKSRRLDRDLYLNIIGRAGRANVSVEGLAFILDSSAPTLKDVVRASLWSTTTADRIRGRLGEVDTTLGDIDSWSAYYDVQSQVMGWLGDGDSYVENQPAALAEKTLSWLDGSARERRAVTDLIADSLEDLETQGYALAASPYQLTKRGRDGRLTGLSTPTIGRLEQILDRHKDGWLSQLVGINEISQEFATRIARLLFEGIELAEHSLWLRRIRGDERAKFAALVRLADGDDRDYYRSDDHEADVQLLSSWLLGVSYIDISRQAPIYERSNALFGGTREPKRTSDATEYVGKLTYPASWIWSGIRVLLGPLGDSMPIFIRDSIEYGLPSEAATQLVTHSFVTRPAALAITSVTGPSWDNLLRWIATDIERDILSLGLTVLDTNRVRNFKERVFLRDFRVLSPYVTLPI